MFSFRRMSSLALACGLAALNTLTAPAPATAQVIDIVPRELYTERLRQEGNLIAFCIDPPGLLADFERDLVQAIGDALLTEVRIIEVLEGTYTTRPLTLDYRKALTTEQIFVLLAQECDAFMGFLLSPINPDWLMISASYVEADVVLVTREDTESLQSVPYDQRIGVRMMAAGDNALIQYLATRPEGQRWGRTPYHDNSLMLERLADGTIGAALIWEPGIYGATGGDPEAAGFNIQRTLPFPVDPIEIGIATRAEDVYLNNLLSEAIAALHADGTIERLLVEHGLAPETME